MKSPIFLLTLLFIVTLATLYPKNTAASGTLITFGNGILTPCERSDDALEALAVKLQYNISQEIFNSLEFKVACNETAGFLNDIFESIRQRLSGDISAFFRFLAGFTLAPDFFQKAVSDIASGITATGYINNEDLQKQVDELYRPALNAEKRVLVVPHSQGNFYANEAFDFLSNVLNIDINHIFSIVSVANPSSFVAGDGPYTTLHEDEVIKFIELLVPSTLDSNTTNGASSPCGTDLLCHFFIDTYLSGEKSGQQIIEHIVDAISAAVEFVPVFNFGPVQQLSTNSGSLENPQIAINASSVHTVWADDDISPEGVLLRSDLFYRRSPDGGISFDPIQNVSTGASAILNSPDVAADGSRVFVVWCRNGVFLRRSTDGGATFAEPVLPFGSGCNPQIVVRGLLVAVVWEDGDAFLQRSTDGGDSFEPAVNLSNGRGGGAPSLAVSGSTVAVVWGESELIDPEEEIFIHTIVSRGSTDSGDTFNPVQNISATTEFPSPHVSVGDQTIGIAWEETDPSTGDTPLPFYRGSLDGGITFGSTKNLSDGMPGVGPVVAADGCVIHTAWLSLAEPRHIAYRRSTDCGLTFEPIQEFLASLPLPGRPQLAVHESTVTLIWQETEIQNGMLRSDIFFAGSIDDGVTFSEPQNVSETNSSSILNEGPGVHQVGLSDAIVAVVWIDDTLGNREVFISSADVPQ